MTVDGFWRSTAEVARVATVAHILSQDACAPSNQSKTHYASLRLSPSGSLQRTSGSVVVHGIVVSSENEVPVVVGVALQPHTMPPKLSVCFRKRAESLRYFVLKYQPNYILTIRALLAFLVSMVDYVARGSLLPLRFTSDHQPMVTRVLRKCLAQPADVPLSLLFTPVKAGGWGCPVITVRSELNFLNGYMAAYDCCSVQA